MGVWVFKIESARILVGWPASTVFYCVHCGAAGKAPGIPLRSVEWFCPARCPACCAEVTDVQGFVVLEACA